MREHRALLFTAALHLWVMSCCTWSELIRHEARVHGGLICSTSPQLCNNRDSQPGAAINVTNTPALRCVCCLLPLCMHRAACGLGDQRVEFPPDVDPLQLDTRVSGVLTRVHSDCKPGYAEGDQQCETLCRWKLRCALQGPLWVPELCGV